MTAPDPTFDPTSDPASGGGRTDRPDIIVLMTDEERAAPVYEDAALAEWRRSTLASTRWFAENGVAFNRHYTGSLACVPSRPTLFTGQYPDVHGVTQTDGLGKNADDSRMRWLRSGEVPTLGNWFVEAGYDTHYDGKWHITHADLIDPITGDPLATNDADGVIDHDAVRAYQSANPLEPFGFSGWVGPEPHGAPMANSGLVRDPLIAQRVVEWLTDRYERRAAGDADALRPFLLVASFVNPHDIVLYPAWSRDMPIGPSPCDPPPVGEPPTRHESLVAKPAAQVAYRESYLSAYGPPAAISRIYSRDEAGYRSLYYRLHAEVEPSLDRVLSVVRERGDAGTVLVRTADHGELLGAHGGLHQKWFTLYDEATRVPMYIARLGAQRQTAIDEPTSHVDVVPTLLALANVDVAAVSERLAERFSEVHPLPGRDLSAVLDGSSVAAGRAVYLMTRDNMMEGDIQASGLARRLGQGDNPPKPLRIQVPAHVGANFEGIVVRVPEADAVGGQGHLWKLARTFDDPDTWTEPGVRHLAADGVAGEMYRTAPLPDEFELYDLDIDPIEAINLASDPSHGQVFTHLVERLALERLANVPGRNNPWPYAARRSNERSQVKAKSGRSRRTHTSNEERT